MRAVCAVRSRPVAVAVVTRHTGTSGLFLLLMDGRCQWWVVDFAFFASQAERRGGIQITVFLNGVI